MEEITDEIIATKVKQGDIDAYGVLVERYENKLKKYGQKFLSHKEDIEDLVQDVFIKAYTNIQSFDPTQRFSPWIYRIAHNAFVNELKRKGRFSLGVFDPDTILPFLTAKETADEATLEEEDGIEMEKILDNLSTKYKEVLILHYFQELSYKEISAILQIPVTTVGVRISRAKKQLKQYHQN